MSRPKKPFPPQPQTKNGTKRVWWNGEWHHLGMLADEIAWKAEYARLIVLWSHDPSAARLDPDEMLISDLGEHYLASTDSPQDGEPRRRVGTVLDLLLELHPQTPVAEFGPQEFRAWQRWLCDLRHPDGHKLAGVQRYNATTVRDFRNVVKSLWKWGVANRGIPPAAWQALLAVPPPKHTEVRPAGRRRPADPAAVERVLPFLPPAIRAIVQLIRLTGARPSEILKLRPGDLDTTAADIWVYTPATHKGTWRGKGRAVYINAAGQEVLRPWLADCAADEFVFTPSKAEAKRLASKAAERKTPKYPSHLKRNAAKRKGRSLRERYDHRALRRAVERACRKAGVEAKFTPYMLRHLMGAEVRKSHGLEAVRAVLGHSYKAMADLYSQEADRELAEAVARGK